MKTEHAELTRNLRAIISARVSSKKKKRSCPFSSAKAKSKKAKNTFDKEWAENWRKTTKVCTVEAVYNVRVYSGHPVYNGH